MGSVLQGYRWRKPIMVNYTADGAQTGYLMKLTIAKGSGVDLAGTTYLGNLGLNWPYDIAFTLIDGVTPVNFWRQEYDATDGTWWMNTPNIPAASPFLGWMYYSSSGAPDLSNIAAWEYFTHFDDADLPAGWTATANYTIGSSIITVKKNVADITAVYYPAGTWNRGYAIETWAKVPKQTSASYCLAMIGFGPYTAAQNIAFGSWSNQSYYGTHCEAGSTTETFSTYAPDASNYHRFTLKYLETYNLDIDGINKISASGNSPNTSIPLTFANAKNSIDYYVDWVGVRKVTANEPTWGVAGRAEACGNRAFGFRREDTQRIRFHRKFNLK